MHQTNAALFSDDTNLSCDELSSIQIEKKLNSDLTMVHKWLLANKQINLNKEKTKYMLIGSKERLDTFSNNRPVIYFHRRTDYQL